MMCESKLISLFALLALLLSIGTVVVSADGPRPPIDPPPEAAEGGPTQGFLTDEVTSDTSGEIRTSDAGMLSSPGIRGWSGLGWNNTDVYGASKTEITAGDGFVYMLMVTVHVWADGGCGSGHHGYNYDIQTGEDAGDDAYASTGAMRENCSTGNIKGEHSAIRTVGPDWSWYDTTEIHHEF